MDETYPAGPSAVPPDLTRPNAAYRRRAYLAVAGLVLFVVAYLALASWFAWTAFRMLSSLVRGPQDWMIPLLGGAGAGFLAVFMLKAIVPARRAQDDREHELTAADHPRLFAFLHRLADDARAPRPHRVFVSVRVNAAVFYDLTIANLVLPSKKNLEIGLGLINVLTLGELKAVLAHEFGHFAQRSMAVGRWVYTAQQIAGHIVVKRDGLDEALQTLSRIDLRVAWIGWILRLIVWSIRSLVDTAFGWVVLAQRALSREMELQADLVAVSLTGSDALIHALHRLEAADDALDRALAFSAGERAGGRTVADVFAVQTRMLEKKRAILDDPTYGQVPPLPADPAAHRVFEAQLAHPPRMWATHPPSELREANAKRVYVPAPLDDRPGWLLFDDPRALRARVTAGLADGSRAPAPPTPLEETLGAIDRAYAHRYFDPAYRGIYLGRSAMRDAASVDELYGAPPPAAELTAALDALYPASLAAELARVRELAAEKRALEALRAGLLEAPGRVVRFRGQDRKRKQLPGLVADVERELTAARGVVRDHDRRVRAVHLAAAQSLSPAWGSYLRGLAALVHYADHADADLDDASGYLNNVIAVVTADGRVSDAEIARLVTAGRELLHALTEVHDAAAEVTFDERIAAAIEVESWSASLGELTLGSPVSSNIGQWLPAAQTWVDAATALLTALRDAALEALLRAEEEVALAVKAGTAAPPPPMPPGVPPRYKLLQPGDERPRQQRLGWWDRFQVADGLLPAAARFAVAGAIVGGVVWAGRAVGDATVFIYNGLSRTVVVDIGERHVEVAAHGHREVEVDGERSYTVRATTRDGRLIESFQARVDDDFGRYVYNVAQTSALVEVVYANDAGDAGAPRVTARRWFETSVDRIHDQLPDQVQSKGDSVSVLASLADEHPAVAVGQLAGDEQAALVMSHARWEPPDAVDLATWISLVPDDQARAIVAARLIEFPDDVITRRVEQDLGGPEVCARHRARASARRSDASWQYLAARCEPDPAAQDRALLDAAARHPDSAWLMYAVAVVDENQARWPEAAAGYDRVRAMLPGLREPIAMRLTRLRRLASSTGRVDTSDLVAQAPRLRWFALLEGYDAPDEASAAAYWKLGRGEVVAAADAARDSVALLLQAAASDGAPSELVARALAVPAATLDPWSALLAYALAARTGNDPAPYLERMTGLGDDERLVKAFLAALRGTGDPAAASAALDGAGLESRAHAYAAAAVLLGDACPLAWRTLALRALFVGERPYLKAS